jgi:integrase/recombinase XerD
MTRVTLDIHHFDHQFDLALRHLQQSDVSPRNKQFIEQFCDACLVRQVCGKVRLIRALGALGLLARDFDKDFDQATREDLERLVTGLLRRQPPYSNETMATYKRILRRFMTFVLCPQEFPHAPVPPCVSWISSHLRKRDRPVIKRSDLLTPAEIEHLLRTATNERDRAFIAVLWEAGPRVAEIGNMQIKHVTRNASGYTIDITGKTGTRSPLIISSAPYLAQWLTVHPAGANPEAPLWVQRRGNEQIGYRTINKTLQQLFRRAGISKPAHPHIFRHSRVTYVLANGIMNEQQAKLYFGWAADSDMPGSTYAHLIDTDVNNAILRENNLAPHQQAQKELQPVPCTICGDLNPPRSDYCQRCRAVLNLSKAYEHQTLGDLKEELFAKMFKLMVEKGLVDEAAREIHDAGLGTVLKRLALHVTGEQPIASNLTSTVAPNTPPPGVKENTAPV